MNSIMPQHLLQLTSNLCVFRGHINVGVLLDKGKALLIDCGDGSVLPALRPPGVEKVEALLFTHHHRDQACGAGVFPDAEVIVPELERRWFEDVSAYWDDPQHRWHLYSFRPHRLMLTQPVHVDRTISDGRTIEWGKARITAIGTPGHTDGSLSFLVDVDGRRFVFSGDLIYDEGRLWELYSLQKGLNTTDYHGFLGAREELIGSLSLIRSADAAAVVPSHGEIMHEPGRAIDVLISRLQECYDCYVEVSALRFYFPEIFRQYEGSPSAMPIRQGVAPPEFVWHVGTSWKRSWMIISESGAAFVMDCGEDAVVAELQRHVSDGEVAAVEGLWVTHYHDDHVDGIPAFRRAFDCEIIADASVAEVIAAPASWYLPAVSPHAVQVDRITGDGETWQWREFSMTAYQFPGQTLHHAALLVEGRGLRMLFGGDSFTPSGIDDYCAQNRNFLGAGVGFDRCLSLVRELKPDCIFNPHVDVAFGFTDEELRQMQENLVKREQLYGSLFPWDHANYGMDASWVHCHPYEQQVAPGAAATVEVVVTNHSGSEHRVCARMAMPEGWGEDSSRSKSAIIPAGRAGSVSLNLIVPPDISPGRYVLPVDIEYAERLLPQFAEAIVIVS